MTNPSNTLCNYTLQAKNEFGEAVNTASLQVNRKYRFNRVGGSLYGQSIYCIVNCQMNNEL